MQNLLRNPLRIPIPENGGGHTMKEYLNPNATLQLFGADLIVSSADDGLKEDLAEDIFD